MADKTYRIVAACPQCGCSGVQALSEREIRERYADAPNIHLECSECLAKYEAAMADACPEWDTQCRFMAKGHLRDSGLAKK